MDRKSSFYYSEVILLQNGWSVLSFFSVWEPGEATSVCWRSLMEQPCCLTADRTTVTCLVSGWGGRGAVGEYDTMLTSTYPKVPAVLDPRQGAGPCPETPAIEVGQNKGKIGRKRRILSVFCRGETDSAVKHGQAVPSEGIQDTCTVLMDRASSRKSNTCSTSHSSRDLSSGKASKP